MTGAYASISAMLKARSGLTLGPDKRYLLENRLAPLFKRENVADLEGLSAKLRPGCPLEAEIVEAMTTNESLFFRDGKPFESLRSTVFPRLHSTRPPTAKLRIWSAAAATGQEAYSVAITAFELAASMPRRQIEILGTDIAREPLARARQGLYSQFEVQRGLPMQMLIRHFTKEDNQWRIKQSLRDAVEFRTWNLLSDLRALGMFDVIFCRNVLIYFDTDTKRQVLDAMARQLHPDGTLFLGGAETVLGVTDAFRAVPEESGTYKRAA